MAWENNFDAKRLDEGYAIFEAGNVKNIKLNDHVIEADVLDGNVYHVMIKHTGTEVNTLDCDCELGSEGQPCSHEAAVLFACEDHLEDMYHVDPKDVEQVLDFVNEKEMRDFLTILLNGDANLLKQFKKLVRYDERREALDAAQVDRVNKAVDQIVASYQDDNPKYNDSQVTYLSHQIGMYFFDEIKQLMHRYLDDFLEAKAYRHVFDIVDHMFGRLDEFYYDHCSPIIKTFIRNTNTYYKKAIGNLEDQGEVYGIILNHINEKEASIFRDDYFYLLNHAFESKYYAKSKKIAAEYIESFGKDKVLEGRELRNYEQWVLFYLRLLIRDNDKEAIKILAMKNWKHISIRKFFSEYCADHGESRWLIQYIKEQIPFERDRESIYYDHYFLKELYKKSNMKKEYRRELDDLFKEFGSEHFELYREVKLSYPKKAWPKYRDKYLAMVTEEAKPYLLAIDKEYSALITQVNATDDITMVNRARAFLKKDHPEVLVNAYKRIANQMVKKTGSRIHYKELGATLKAMIDLKNGPDQIVYLVETYTKKYPRRKLMIEELSPILIDAKAAVDLA